MESPFCVSDLALKNPDFALIETLGWTGRELARLDLHLVRLARGAQLLGMKVDLVQAQDLLKAATLPDRPARLRLTCKLSGALEVVASDMPAAQMIWRVGLSNMTLDPHDPYLQIKSTHRPVYDAARQHMAPQFDEMILTNAQSEVCDGTITTVFFDRGQGLCTPPQTAGLLPGILRQEMLSKGLCREETLMAQDLHKVRLFVGNALRGLIEANFYP